MRKCEGDKSERVTWRLKLCPKLRPSFFSSAFDSEITFPNTASLRLLLLTASPSLGFYTEILPTALVCCLTTLDNLCLLLSLSCSFSLQPFTLPPLFLLEEQRQDCLLSLLLQEILETFLQEVLLQGQGRGHHQVQETAALGPDL